MLPAFCSDLVESTSTWLDKHCFHHNRNRNSAHSPNPLASCEPQRNPKLLASPEPQRKPPLQPDDSKRLNLDMPVNSEPKADSEPHPEPPRAQLRRAYQNAKHVLTSLLAIEFIIEGLFKHRKEVLVAVEGIRHHLRSDHGGVLPDVLLGEWCRKRKPYAPGTMSKLGSSVRLTRVGLERAVEWWADWGRVEAEFWFLVEEDCGFRMVGRASEETFVELERTMREWVGERERRKHADSGGDVDSVPSGDSANTAKRVETPGEDGLAQQQRPAMTDIISVESEWEGLEKEEEFLQYYSLIS